ncbi:hypothetical protein H8957_016322, partial [Semnopithecus entellus]
PSAPPMGSHREEGAAFSFCRVCLLRPHRGKWRSWDVNLGPQGRGLLGCGPYPSGEPRCSLLLRPPSQGDLPVLVTHPIHHQQLAGVSGCWAPASWRPRAWVHMEGPGGGIILGPA